MDRNSTGDSTRVTRLNTLINPLWSHWQCDRLLNPRHMAKSTCSPPGADTAGSQAYKPLTYFKPCFGFKEINIFIPHSKTQKSQNIAVTVWRGGVGSTEIDCSVWMSISSSWPSQEWFPSPAFPANFAPRGCKGYSFQLSQVQVIKMVIKRRQDRLQDSKTWQDGCGWIWVHSKERQVDIRKPFCGDSLASDL